MNIAISCCNENTTLEGYDSHDLFYFLQSHTGIGCHNLWLDTSPAPPKREQHHSSVDLDGGTCPININTSLRQWTMDGISAISSHGGCPGMSLGPLMSTSRLLRGSQNCALSITIKVTTLLLLNQGFKKTGSTWLRQHFIMEVYSCLILKHPTFTSCTINVTTTTFPS